MSEQSIKIRTTNNRKYITPNWPAPNNIKAFCTARQGGVSDGRYHSFNLGDNTQDSPENILTNKNKLITDLELPNSPLWINQVHGNNCIELNTQTAQKSLSDQLVSADAVFTTQPNNICLVRTADCLPILLCDTNGAHSTAVAAVHAGWKGFIAGVIENAIDKFNHQLKLSNTQSSVIAWLGPAISQKHFELGPEVYELFIEKYNFAENYFIQKNQKHFLDLTGLAKAILEKHHITTYYQDFCTYEQDDLFYSYRRDHDTGRMASLIWLEKQNVPKSG